MPRAVVHNRALLWPAEGQVVDVANREDVLGLLPPDLDHALLLPFIRVETLWQSEATPGACHGRWITSSQFRATPLTMALSRFYRLATTFGRSASPRGLPGTPLELQDRQKPTATGRRAQSAGQSPGPG